MVSLIALVSVMYESMSTLCAYPQWTGLFHFNKSGYLCIFYFPGEASVPRLCLIVTIFFFVAGLVC